MVCVICQMAAEPINRDFGGDEAINDEYLFTEIQYVNSNRFLIVFRTHCENQLSELSVKWQPIRI